MTTKQNEVGKKTLFLCLSVTFCNVGKQAGNYLNMDQVQKFNKNKWDSLDTGPGKNKEWPETNQELEL